MTKNEKVGLGILGALAVAGVGFYVYEQNKHAQSTASPSTYPTATTGTTSSSSTSSSSGSSSPSYAPSTSSVATSQTSYPLPSGETVIGNFTPSASQVSAQQLTGISGPVTPAISGTSPSLGDPGFIQSGKWYPTINQVPNRSSAVAAWSVDPYYDQFTEVVS